MACSCPFLLKLASIYLVATAVVVIVIVIVVIQKINSYIFPFFTLIPSIRVRIMDPVSLLLLLLAHIQTRQRTPQPS